MSTSSTVLRRALAALLDGARGASATATATVNA
jgi:hypothetical protein